MNFLLINSGDKNTFAAFYRQGSLSVSYSSDFPNTDDSSKQPDKLIHCIDELNSKFDFASIDAVAVTVGPGSFTGIRVGLSLAKGLAFGLDKKLIPINNFKLTLNRLTEIIPEKEYFILLPAKPPEYYFSVIKNGQVLKSGCVFTENLKEFAKNNVVFVGDFDDETSVKHSYFTYINVKNLKSEADSMLELAIEMFNNGGLANPSEIEPLYLKDFSFGNQSKSTNS